MSAGWRRSTRRATIGTVALRRRIAYRSTSLWASYSDFYRVHGHPEYRTRIEWLDGTPNGLTELT
jgi:hypothetical protein